ncbi:MAG TPA: PKD domain-containing protein [Flavobacteriales bacterium]|nr:PKD domain-containing protein [Flavobacteriales bacterium]
MAGSTQVQNMSWSFYDGSFQQSSSPYLQWTFPGQQQWPVCLTVDAYDLIAQEPCSTTVCDLITPLPDPSCTSLQASFSISDVTGSTVTFVDNSTFTGQAPQAIWSFGDGSSISAQPAPSHEFVGTGPFQVCLTLVGPEPTFCTSTLCQYLYLGPGNVDCPVLVQQGFIMLQLDNLVGVLDTSLTSGMNSRIDWDFGDGALAEGNVAVHAYATSGQFEVCGTLRTWGPLLADTCVTSLCKGVTPTALAGIATQEQTSTWNIVANPVRDVLVITGRFDRGRVEVFDAAGRSVRYLSNYRGQRLEMDVQALDPGLYVVRISDGVCSWARPLVKE